MPGYKLLFMNFNSRAVGGIPRCDAVPVHEMYIDATEGVLGVTVLKGEGVRTFFFNDARESELALQRPDGGIIDIGTKWGSDVKEKWLAAIRAGLL